MEWVASYVEKGTQRRGTIVLEKAAMAFTPLDSSEELFSLTAYDMTGKEYCVSGLQFKIPY